MMMAVVAFTSCSNDNEVFNSCAVESEQNHSQTFTFRMTGADLSVTQTRASLTANGSALTDLYVLDYDKTTGTLLQVLHQQSSDPKFAEPELTLTYGQHTVRFVATRSTGSKLTLADGTEFVTTPGTVQAVSTAIPALYSATKITDTFSAEIDVTAGAGNTGSATVTLNRTVSRLQIVMTDAIPADADHVEMTISTGYYSLPLATLLPTATSSRTTTISIADLAGVKNQKLAAYTLAPTDSWTSDVIITTKRADNSTISTFTLQGVSFLRNKTTSVQGEFFQRSSALTFSVNDSWLEDDVINI